MKDAQLKNTEWRKADDPPHAAPGLWSKPVVCVTNEGNAYMLLFMGGDTHGDGHWQRLGCFEPYEKVILWTENPDE